MYRRCLCKMSMKRSKRFFASEVGFFEGPEKLLEVWFDFESSAYERGKGLRGISREEWEKVLDKTQCKILSSCSNEYINAYLLSESALVISDHRFILKTCGRSTLLSAINPLLSLIQLKYPGSQLKNLYYSHQKFQEPVLQPHVYCNFSSEVLYLNQIFKDGVSSQFGSKDDAWYLYSVERGKLEVPDQTLEILMKDLDPDFMALFSTAAYSSSKHLIADLGLDELVDGAIIDAKIFEPCGFSLNAINKDVYYTIHVTPQVECSWVSFETNLELNSCIQLIKKVLAKFNPSKASVSLMTNKDVTSIEIDAILGENIRYSCSVCENRSLAVYNVIYIELNSVKSIGCISRVMSWTKNVRIL